MTASDVIEWCADGTRVGLISLDRVAGPLVEQIPDMPDDAAIDRELARMAAERLQHWPTARLQEIEGY